MSFIEPVSKSDVTVLPSGQIIRMTWQPEPPAPPAHEFAAIACPEEEDGGYSVFALNYPGVVSQGETLDEARANISEAFLAMLESARKRGRGMEFSFTPVVDAAPNCVRFRVRVNG